MVTLESEKCRPGEKIAVLCKDCEKTHLFTLRQWEVVQLVGQGLSNEQIADILFIVPMTVEFHTTNILNNLDCIGKGAAFPWGYKRAQLVFWWRQHLGTGGELTLPGKRKKRMTVNCENCNSPHSFTPGQWKVVSMIYQGLSNEQIARELSILRKSAENLTSTIYKEVSCARELVVPKPRRTHLISWAQRHADAASIISSNIAIYCRECDDTHALTPRVWEAFRLADQGLSNEQIARVMWLTLSSVESYTNVICKEFSCIRNRSRIHGQARVNLVIWWQKHADSDPSHERTNLSRKEVQVLCQECQVRHSFTTRQWQVCNLICRGLSNQAIKRIIGVEPWLNKIYHRLTCFDEQNGGINNPKRARLVVWWTKHIGTGDDALKPPRPHIYERVAVPCQDCGQTHVVTAYMWKVLSLIGQELTSKQIAKTLDIKLVSVPGYLGKIYRKITCLQNCIPGTGTQRPTLAQWWRKHTKES